MSSGIATGSPPVVTGGRVSGTALQFTKDSKYFLCAVGCSIKVFSVATSAAVAVLTGHERAVTGLAIDQTNSQRVFSSSIDGTVRCWDYMDAKQTSPAIELGFRVVAVVHHPSRKGEIFIACDEEDGRQSRVLQHELRKKRTTRLLKSKKPVNGLVLSHNGRAVATLSNNRLLVHDLQQKELFKHTHKRALCGIAASPSEDLIATSDVSGRIVLWYGVADAKPRTATMHWHAHKAPALHFSSDGRQLLSGGQESVLVLWRIESGEGGQKQFLPRQGSAISCVSSDHCDGLFGLVCADNSVRVIEAASLNLKQKVDGIFPTSSSVQCPMTMNPRSASSVWIAGRPGSLQCWDYTHQKAVGELEIVKQNLLSQTNNETPLYLHVQFVGVSHDGCHLVSADRRETQPQGSAVQCSSHLKFWEFDASTRAFILNTQCDEPHKGLISSLCFDPHTPQLATSGEDGEFKLWRTRLRAQGTKLASSAAGGRKASWGCTYQGSYCGQSSSCSQFSPDGSVLAMGFGATLTLWSTQDKISLVYSAPHQPQSEPLTHLGFIANRPNLVACNQAGIFIWDLLTMTPTWQYEVAGVGLLMCHPRLSTFSVTVTVQLEEVKQQFLVLWEDFSESTTPSKKWQLDCKPHTGSFVGSMREVLLLTDTQELVLFNSALTEQDSVMPRIAGQVQDQASAFDAIFGASSKRQKKQPENGTAAQSGGAEGSNLSVFGAIPTHTLPALDTLCNTLLRGLLPTNKPSTPEPVAFTTASTDPPQQTGMQLCMTPEVSEDQLQIELETHSKEVADMFASWPKPRTADARKRKR